MQDINLQKDYEMALMLERQESTSKFFRSRILSMLLS